QTDLLHGGAVGEELHFHRMLLANAPRAPAGLPQSVERIAGFVKEDGRKLQQIESGLNQLGMADNDVDPALQLLAVPGLPFMGGHAGAEHTGANPLGSQQLLTPCRYVVLVGVDGQDFPCTSEVQGRCPPARRKRRCPSSTCRTAAVMIRACGGSSQPSCSFWSRRYL